MSATAGSGPSTSRASKRKWRKCFVCKKDTTNWKNEPEDPAGMVACAQCNHIGHPECWKLGHIAEAVRAYPWMCDSCSVCEVCETDEERGLNKLYNCSSCDRVWHLRCLEQGRRLDRLVAKPETWRCPTCERSTPTPPPRASAPRTSVTLTSIRSSASARAPTSHSPEMFLASDFARSHASTSTAGSASTSVAVPSQGSKRIRTRTHVTLLGHIAENKARLARLGRMPASSSIPGVQSKSKPAPKAPKMRKEANGASAADTLAISSTAKDKGIPLPPENITLPTLQILPASTSSGRTPVNPHAKGNRSVDEERRFQEFRRERPERPTTVVEDAWVAANGDKARASEIIADDAVRELVVWIDEQMALEAEERANEYRKTTLEGNQHSVYETPKVGVAGVGDPVRAHDFLLDPEALSHNALRTKPSQSQSKSTPKASAGSGRSQSSGGKAPVSAPPVAGPSRARRGKVLATFSKPKPGPGRNSDNVFVSESEFESVQLELQQDDDSAAVDATPEPTSEPPTKRRRLHNDPAVARSSGYRSSIRHSTVRFASPTATIGSSPSERSHSSIRRNHQQSRIEWNVQLTRIRTSTTANPAAIAQEHYNNGISSQDAKTIALATRSTLEADMHRIQRELDRVRAYEKEWLLLERRNS